MIAPAPTPPRPAGASRDRDQGSRAAAKPTRAINPYVLGYLMGPTALVLLLVLRKVGAVTQTPAWVWLAVIVVIQVTSRAADQYSRHHRSGAGLHVRAAVHVAAVSTVVYLSGWGPVLIGAFAFVALENLAHDGSRTWRISMGWSLAAITVAQTGVWLEWVPSFLTRTQGAALGLMGTFILVFVVRMAGAAWEKKEDAERTMRASEEWFRSLVQRSSDTTLVVDADQIVSYASPATRELLGRPPETVVGAAALDIVHPDDRHRVKIQLVALLRSASTIDPVEFRVRHADGTVRTVEAMLSDLRDRPSVQGFVANLRDITERKEAEALLAHQAVHDPLTGLANRTLILDRAEQMLVRADRAHHSVAALFIDIDHFKEINDTFGHDAGDRLLQALADRLTATARAGDTVGRLGGDEFVVLAENLSPGTGPELLAERIRDVLRAPFHLDGPTSPPRSITASIGIADGTRSSAKELLRDADTALYRAKALGKDRWAAFQPEMQSEVLDHLTLKMDLLSALEQDEFFLLYQPLLELETSSIYGVEALLRWQHPTRGVIGPDEFIPILEEMGLIVEVGHWVLDQACRQAAAWHRAGHSLTMSVNISMRQLESPLLLGRVTHALAHHDLAPDALLLEITESALMRDADETIARLRQLKALGIKIAIDDFGTGYSSLSYLREFPVDALKIDRSFISGLASSPESSALIRTMIDLGRALGLGTIAEGIEDDAQLRQLRLEGCERGQGFLFSRPVDSASIDALLGEPAGRESRPPSPYRSVLHQPIATG